MALLLVGLVCGGVAYWLISEHGFNVGIIVPAVVAATVGASHITKRAPA